MARYYSNGGASSGGSVPSWTEDGNSPHTASGVSSSTYTLSGQYDQVMVKYQYVVGSESSRTDLFMQVNGDASGSYNWVNSDGTNGTASDVIILGGAQSSWGYAGDVRIDGSWSNTNGLVGASVLTPNDITQTFATRFAAQSVSSPLDSWTLEYNTGTISLRGRVFGLDI